MEKKIVNKSVLLLLLCYFFSSTHLDAFDKVVIWGHKLHTHTHSYIHNAFYRAFKEKGYPVSWFDDSDDLAYFDFSGSLFITEGQVDKKMPVRLDCEYILHNCDAQKYSSVVEAGCAIYMQVYTDMVLMKEVETIAPCICLTFPKRRCICLGRQIFCLERSKVYREI